MNLKLFLLSVLLLPGLLTNAKAAEGERVSLVYDETYFDKDLTKDTVRAHLGNLMVALLENREDVLKKMDDPALKLDKKKLEIAGDHAKKLDPIVKVALIAALEQRGDKNQNVLKQVLDVLKASAEKVKEAKKIDMSIVGVEFDDDNVKDHLDNITIALLKGDEGVLKVMDAKDNALDEGEIIIAREGMTQLTPGEKAALIAALKARGDANKHALKQLLEILTAQI